MHSMVEYLLRNDFSSIDQLEAGDVGALRTLDVPKEIVQNEEEEDVNRSVSLEELRPDEANEKESTDSEREQMTQNKLRVSATQLLIRRHKTEERMNHAEKYCALYDLTHRYKHMPHYKHSLELLLHQALQVVISPILVNIFTLLTYASTGRRGTKEAWR